MKNKAMILSSLILMATLFFSFTANAFASAAAQEVRLDPASPVEITFYAYSIATATEGEAPKGLLRLVNDFNETVGKEKGVHVTAIPDPLSDVGSKARSDIQAGLPVDVIQNDFTSLDENRANYGLAVFEDIFPLDEMNSHFEGIFPAARELGKIDGKTYGISSTLSMPILFINGTIFREAGLDPEQPLNTWVDVAAAAKTIKEKTGLPGLGFTTDPGWDTDAAQSLIFTNNGKMLSDDRSAAVFADAGIADAFKDWKQTYLDGSAALGTQREVFQGFAAGKVGMYFISSALLSTFTKASAGGGWELYGQPTPGIGDKAATPVNSGSALAVRSDSPLKSLAIWEFIKYMTSDEAYTVIASELGYVPLRENLLDNEAYLKGYADANPILRVATKELDTMIPVTIWPAGTLTESLAIFADGIKKAVTTDGDTEAIMKEAQDQITQILQSSY